MPYDHNKWVQNEVIVPRHAPYRKWAILAYLVVMLCHLFATSAGILDYKIGMPIFMTSSLAVGCLGPTTLNPLSPDEYQKAINGRAHVFGYYILAAIFLGLFVWLAVAGALGWTSPTSGLPWFLMGCVFFMLVLFLPIGVGEFLLPPTVPSDFDEDVEIGCE